MDAAALSALLVSSTATLSTLHAQLGCPPAALQQSLEKLRDALQQAVDTQLEKTRLDVEAAQKGCSDREREIEGLASALDVEATKEVVGAGKPLLARIDLLDAKVTSLREEYNVRSTHVNSLRTQIDTYVPLLGTFMPNVPALPQGTPPAISASYIESLRGSLRTAEAEHVKRTGELRAHLLTILQLWSELCILPSTPLSHDGTPTSTAFAARVLSHLRLRAIEPMLQGEAWEGNFESIADDAGDTSISSPPSSPTTRSRPSNALSSTLTQPNHALAPDAESLQAAMHLRAALEEEKSRREATIQELYDALYTLWERFGVPESEMEAFVLANSGATMVAIEAYSVELIKMRELKASHMATFIASIRQRIADVWDQLQLGTQERQESFPSFFLDLADDGASGSMGLVEPTDELLAEHEAYEALARGEYERKAPLLKMVARYQALLEEGAELERAATDKDRLKGKRGRPGALLEEEKTRKRLKVLKPKLEEELLRNIPIWEEESGRAFMIDGVRYIDELEASAGPSAATKKRTRTISGSSTASGASSCPPLSASALSNRTGAGAATPMRGGGLPSASKKPRLGSASVASSARATPATATRKPPASAAGSAIRAPASVARGAGGRTASAIPQPASAAKFGCGASARVATSTGIPASTNTYRATQSFRPRPSSGAATQQWVAVPSRYPAHGAPDTLSRLPSDSSFAASDATTLESDPSSLAASAASVRRGARPSQLLGESLAARSVAGSAYAKPSITGAGATIRSISSSSSGSSNADKAYHQGPNWAVLDEDEEEEELWPQQGQATYA